MAKVGLVGPYNQIMKDSFYRNLPEGFEAVEVPTREQYGLLSDVDYILNRTIEITGKDLEKFPRLRLITKYAVGYDNLDLKAAGEKDIPITNCKGFNSDSVAELTLAHMLCVYRNILPQYEALKKGEWSQDKYVNQSFTIHGKTVGIIGLGSIGSRVAGLVQAFGAKVLYYDIVRRSEEEEKEKGWQYVSMEELLASSDIVTLHCPGSAATHHLIGKEELALMKPSSVLINCARGTVVDQEALIAALKEKRLAGAGVDVFEEEPPVNNPLLDLPNVSASPHVGGTTYGLGAGMVKLCLEFMKSFDEGKGLPRANIVNYAFLAHPEKCEVTE